VDGADATVFLIAVLASDGIGNIRATVMTKGSKTHRVSETTPKSVGRAGWRIQEDGILAFASLLLAMAGIFLVVHITTAEPARDRMLEDVRLVLTEESSVIEIRFPFRLQYLSHFPEHQGKELRIRFRPIQIPETDLDAVRQREAVVPRYGRVVDLDEIDYEGDIDQDVYTTLLFSQPVTFEVTPAQDFTAVYVKVFPSGSAGSRN